MAASNEPAPSLGDIFNTTSVACTNGDYAAAPGRGAHRLVLHGDVLVKRAILGRGVGAEFRPRHHECGRAAARALGRGAACAGASASARRGLGPPDGPGSGCRAAHRAQSQGMDGARALGSAVCPSLTLMQSPLRRGRPAPHRGIFLVGRCVRRDSDTTS